MALILFLHFLGCLLRLTAQTQGTENKRSGSSGDQWTQKASLCSLCLWSETIWIAVGERCAALSRHRVLARARSNSPEVEQRCSYVRRDRWWHAHPLRPPPPEGSRYPTELVQDSRANFPPGSPRRCLPHASTSCFLRSTVARAFVRSRHQLVVLASNCEHFGKPAITIPIFQSALPSTPGCRRRCSLMWKVARRHCLAEHSLCCFHRLAERDNVGPILASMDFYQKA